MEKLGPLRELYKGILTLQADTESHELALIGLKSGYAAHGAQTTNFEVDIKRLQVNQNQQRNFDPETSLELANFDEKTGLAVPANGDEDVVVDDGGAFMNEKCPLTARLVMDLEDPVEDAKGFIYSKFAIEQHIRQESRKGPVKCPVSGTSHYISIGELKASESIFRAKRRARFTQTERGPPKHAGRDSQVLDADED
eukprot:gene20750-27570_t